MPIVVKDKRTDIVVYRQEPPFLAGNGIKSAMVITGIKEIDLIEVELTDQEYNDDLDAQSKKMTDLISLKDVVDAKYEGLKKDDITDSDALEYLKLDIALKLGLEI